MRSFCSLVLTLVSFRLARAFVPPQRYCQLEEHYHQQQQQHRQVQRSGTHGRTVISTTTSPLFQSFNINNNNNSNKDDGDKNGSMTIAKLSAAVQYAWNETQNYDFGKVWENLKSTNNLSRGGEKSTATNPSSRGEIYFVLQAALIAFFLLGNVPVVWNIVKSLLTTALLIFGLTGLWFSVIDLGADALSPFPKPTESATLKTTGVYGQVRHPMYAALLSTLLGLGLLSNSVDRLVLTAILYYLIDVKSDKEEELLMDKFGRSYRIYMNNVPHKFVPASVINALPWTKKN